jgi:hypothetical protein
VASEGGAGPRLGALQNLLYDLITAPTGVGPGLVAKGMATEALDAVIVGDARLSATARLDVYANMYFFRILDVLRDEFPRVSTLVGDNAFHDLITDYLLAERPAHPSLREAGARLPAYLTGHPLARALATEYAGLAELARLERTHRELFDGPDAPPVTMDELRALAPDAFVALSVRLVPCHALLAHQAAWSTVWLRLGAGESVAPLPREEWVLVWRQGMAVRHRSVDEVAERAMLERAAGGATLGQLCEVFVTASAAGGSVDEDEATLAGLAFGVLARWVDDGLLTCV